LGVDGGDKPPLRGQQAARRWRESSVLALRFVEYQRLKADFNVVW